MWKFYEHKLHPILEIKQGKRRSQYVSSFSYEQKVSKSSWSYLTMYIKYSRQKQIWLPYVNLLKTTYPIPKKK